MFDFKNLADTSPENLVKKPKILSDSSSNQDEQYELVLIDSEIKSKVTITSASNSLFDQNHTSEIKENFVLPETLVDFSNEIKTLTEIKKILHPNQIKIDIPEDFLCPITGELMRDPVTTADGQTYEREVIEEWLEQKNTSPLTGSILENKSLTSAVFAKKMINNFLETHIELKDSTEWYLPKVWVKDLEKACQTGDEKAITDIFNRDRRLLVQTFQASPYKGKTALQFAVTGNPLSIDTIINALEKRQKGLALESLLQTDAEGRFPLHLAIFAHQNAETLLKLMAWMGNHLGKMELPEQWFELLPQRTLNQILIWSVIHNDIAKVRCLLKLKTDPNLTNRNGQTPLCLAAIHNRTEIAELLIQYKALLNVQDEEGNTALHLAEKFQAHNVMRILITEGASTKLKNKTGYTPRQVSFMAGYQETTNLHDQIVKDLEEKEQNLFKDSFLGLFLLRQQRVIEAQQSKIQELERDKELLKREVHTQRNEIEKLKTLPKEIVNDLRQKEIKPLIDWKNRLFTKEREHCLTIVTDREQKIITAERAAKLKAEREAQQREELRLLSLQDELVAACESGDLKAVQTSMQRGAQSNAVNSKGKHPIGAAIWSMNPQVISYLIEKNKGVAPMNWENCTKHNLTVYGRVFIISEEKFLIKSYKEWTEFLEKITPSLFLQNYQLEKVQKAWPNGNFQEITKLKEYVKRYAGSKSFSGSDMFYDPDGCRSNIDLELQKFRTQIKEYIEKGLNLEASMSSSSRSSTTDSPIYQFRG